ncbi:class I adenylate-forming enzyme family protein [Actinomarinicola tropica]|nr:AMP-binding protein [Actinomarinicola tropica]
MNLASIVDGHPDDDVALVADAEQVTYGELRRRAGGVRGALVAAGRRPGDRVGLVSSNDVDFVTGLLGIIGAGLVAVPLNPQSPRPEIDPELTVVGAASVLVGPSGRRLGITRAIPVAELWDHDPAPVVDVEPDDLAVLVFTSGTAGAPRAAGLTHRNLLANIEQVGAVGELARRRDDVTLGVLPMFHVFGLNVVLLPALQAGAQVVLVDQPDPAQVAGTVADRGVTTLTGPPTLWRAVAQLPPGSVPADAFATVRIAASGAATLPVEVAAAVLERFGLRVHEGYGLTETSPVVATSAGTDAPIGSIGRPLPGVEVRLVDEGGDDVLVGDVGEILVRGDNVFAGYWDDPEATASVVDGDGWLHTGDLATVDDDGHLFVVDRRKDVVIVSGFNVYPGEVESALLQHPDVVDAAVVGEPDDRTGEAVVAYVVVRPGATADAESLGDAVGERLARYKCPRAVRLVHRIPRGLGGKVQRHRLPDRAP